MATYMSTDISKELIYNNLKSQRNTGQFCDIRLVIGDKFTFIHSAVVCPVSLFLYNTFLEMKQRLRFKKGEKLSPSCTEINLKGFNSEDCFPCLNKIMNLIYGTTIIIETEHYCHFQSYCSKLFIKNIFLSNEHLDNDPVEYKINETPVQSEHSENEESMLNKFSLYNKNIEKESEVFTKINDFVNDTQFLLCSDESKVTNEIVIETKRIDYNLLKDKNFSDSGRTEVLKHEDGSLSPKNIIFIPQSFEIDDDYGTPQITESENKVLSKICNIKKSNSANKWFKSQTNNTTRKKQICLECKREFSKNVDLLNHLIETKHGGNVCSFCNTEVATSQLEKHLVIHKHTKPYLCVCCNLRFKTKSLYETHFLSHVTQRLFTCNQCGKASKSKLALKYHLRIHSNEKKYLCDKCGFSTLYQGMIRAHKRLHDGTVLKCSYPNCMFTSIYKGHLKEHFLSHENGHPFVCDKCGLKFTRKVTLRRHALKHNNSICCPHCRFKASRKDILVSHMYRRHTAKDSHLDVNNVNNEEIKHQSSEVIALVTETKAKC